MAKYSKCQYKYHYCLIEKRCSWCGEEIPGKEEPICMGIRDVTWVCEACFQHRRGYVTFLKGPSNIPPPSIATEYLFSQPWQQEALK
jgi:hypothetical protein